MRTTTRWRRSAAALAGVLIASGAYGAHPLTTEDTGTQGRGGWQLELNGERNKEAGTRGAQASAVLSYGAGETVDIQFGIPWEDTGAERGAGDLTGAVKWRFWEQGAWSAGVRAGVTAPTGDEQRGLGTGRPTWGALLIGQYEGERWIYLGHLGYRRNLNSLGERDSIGEISGALLYKVAATLKLLVDATRSTNPDPGSDRALAQVVLGAIWSVSKELDLDLGVRRGNDPAIDRAIMAGITLRW